MPFTLGVWGQQSAGAQKLAKGRPGGPELETWQFAPSFWSSVFSSVKCGDSRTCPAGPREDKVISTHGTDSARPTAGGSCWCDLWSSVSSPCWTPEPLGTFHTKPGLLSGVGSVYAAVGTPSVQPVEETALFQAAQCGDG